MTKIFYSQTTHNRKISGSMYFTVEEISTVKVVDIQLNFSFILDIESEDKNKMFTKFAAVLMNPRLCHAKSFRYN